MADYRNLRDMFDGGGAGMSGPEFEGGGLLSDIGNLLFKPLGYRERMAQQQMPTRAAPQPMMRQPQPQPQPTQPSQPITMDELKALFARIPGPISQGPIPGPVQPPQEWGQPGSTVDPMTFLRALGYRI